MADVLQRGNLIMHRSYAASGCPGALFTKRGHGQKGVTQVPFFMHGSGAAEPVRKAAVTMPCACDAVNIVGACQGLMHGQATSWRGTSEPSPWSASGVTGVLQCLGRRVR